MMWMKTISRGIRETNSVVAEPLELSRTKSFLSSEFSSQTREGESSQRCRNRNCSQKEVEEKEPKDMRKRIRGWKISFVFFFQYKMKDRIVSFPQEKVKTEVELQRKRWRRSMNDRNRKS